MKTTCVMLFLCICSILLLFTSAASKQNKWKVSSFKISNKHFCKAPRNVRKAINSLRNPRLPPVCKIYKTRHVQSIRTPRQNIIWPCHVSYNLSELESIQYIQLIQKSLSFNNVKPLFSKRARDDGCLHK